MGLFSAGLNYVGTQETNAANRQLQRETNEMNYQIAQEANQTSRDIAAEQNEWNYRMFNEQNTWNLQQWERENEYNSPKQQVQRYIEAGINPLWAIGSGNPGNAQQLTSAAASPAAGADVNVPQMEAARMQAPDFSSLSGIAQNVINGIQGFQRLKIEQQEANTRSRKADADIDLSSTQANYYNSLAEGVNLDNIFNKDTFSTRVQQLQSNLDKTRSEINHLDKDSELYSGKQALLDSQVNLNKAMVTKSEAEIKQTIASIAQRWQEIKLHGQELGIAQQNADTASGQLKVSQAQFGLAVEKAKSEFQQKSNQQILDYLKLDSNPMYSAHRVVSSLFGNDKNRLSEFR